MKKIKAIKNEIKENVQGTNSEGKETRTQINDLEQKEEIKIRPEQNEETRIQKKWGKAEEPLDNFKHVNMQIIRVQEGEQEKKEIETLFEK